MIKELKDFLFRGNVLDLAVAVVMGAAFNAIITSLVSDIIMPPIGMLTGGINFADMFIALDGEAYASLAEAQAVSAPTINYGLFINAVISFIIVAFAVFMLVRQINALKRQPAPLDPTTKECPYCKETIAIGAIKCKHCTADLK